MTLFDGIYLFALTACSPCLLVGLLLLKPLRVQFKRQFFSLPAPMEKSGPRVWVHAASVGEMALALELAARLRTRRPELSFVFTTNKDTALAQAEAQGEAVFYKPFDLTFFTKALVKRLRPDLLVLIETELWPNLIAPLKIPILLANGRLSPQRIESYQKAQWVYRPLLAKIDSVLASDRASQAGFENLGAKVELVGNLKFGPTEPPPSELVDRMVNLLKLKPGDWLLVCGSVGPDEMGELLAAFEKIRAQKPNARLVLVPRHPEKAPQFQQAAQEAGWSLGLASQGPWGADDLFLVDQMGVLKGLYALADLVFVGGSFNRRGGQNMIEPAGLGRPVAVGPNTPNFAEAVDLLTQAGGLAVVRNGAELARLALEPERLETLGQKALDALEKESNAWNLTLEKIDEILADPA